MDFNWAFPYSSQRMPVLARNVVATSQPLAAQAGLRMLEAGGNAVDAAVAAAITLTVVEPTSNGIGSDAFALVWAGGGLHGLNASGRSPKTLSAERFEGMDSVPVLGWDGVTTPGAVSAWGALSRRFGALEFGKLFAPAIEYATSGFLVSPQTAYYWKLGQERYTGELFEPWQKTFCPAGRAPAAGERFASPDHAATLQQIAETGGDALYRGELARQIAAHAQATGGLLTADDLQGHKVAWVRPISTTYHGFTLHEIPPNGQGLAALIMLGILDRLAVHEQPVLAQRAALVDPERAAEPEPGAPKPGGTVYLTAADAEGTMVSYIQSNYTGFGSGIVIPGTGIALQNRGCCFTLEKGHPNEAGPAKRPYHTIIPGFVTKGDEPIMSFGVMGGFMQPQGHAQVVIRIADHRQNPQAALDAPRWRVDGDRRVAIEPGFPARVYDELRGLGHEVTIADARTVAHGGGQVIYRLEDGYLGASDLRRDGQAVGF
jgi:gamma-glutamyltranspeptidase/glutathione hydrolase